MASTRRDWLISAAAVAGSAVTREAAASQAPAVATPSPAPLLLSVADFRHAARDRMASPAYEYMEAGAADEITLGWNQEAFQRLRIRPRVLVDVSRIDTRITLLGHQHPIPILLAPTGYNRMMHPDGELGVVRAAGTAGVTLVVSSSATTSVEELARAASAPLWFQLYLQPDRELSLSIVRRAEAAGCRALCLTVDAPVSGPQNRIARSGFALPPDMPVPMNPLASDRRRRAAAADGGNEGFRVRYPATWTDVDWLRSSTSLPVLLKGILDPEDADQAVQAGVQGIIVSNHGARSLDTAPATIDVLPAIVDRVAGRVPVLMDGGIRRGTDVLKALALGATATLVGRAYLYGLGASGEDGVRRVIGILRSELEMAMALSGRTTIGAIDRSTVLPPAC